MQLRQPRLADMVAGVLRERIVQGELKDGEIIGRQDDLLTEFGISKPSMREALRILESEGLITVLRGNAGGAVIHTPQEHNAAQAITLVLRSRHVRLGDLAAALSQLEPVCVRMCAQRPDRAETVVPVLHEANEDIRSRISQPLEFTRAARGFHEQLVRTCGNDTMITLIGTLEAVWSAQENTWAGGATDQGAFPSTEMRETGVRAHERLIELIAAGAAGEAERASRKHVEAAQWYALSGNDTTLIDRADPASPGR